MLEKRCLAAIPFPSRWCSASGRHSLSGIAWQNLDAVGPSWGNVWDPVQSEVLDLPEPKSKTGTCVTQWVPLQSARAN